MYTLRFLYQSVFFKISKSLLLVLLFVSSGAWAQSAFAHYFSDEEQPSWYFDVYGKAIDYNQQRTFFRGVGLSKVIDHKRILGFAFYSVTQDIDYRHSGFYITSMLTGSLAQRLERYGNIELYGVLRAGLAYGENVQVSGGFPDGSADGSNKGRNQGRNKESSQGSSDNSGQVKDVSKVTYGFGEPQLHVYWGMTKRVYLSAQLGMLLMTNAQNDFSLGVGLKRIF